MSSSKENIELVFACVYWKQKHKTGLGALRQSALICLSPSQHVLSLQCSGLLKNMHLVLLLLK